MVIPSLWKISGWNGVEVHHEFVDQQAVLPVDVPCGKQQARWGGRPLVPIWSPTHVPVSFYGLKRPRAQSSSVSSVHGQGQQFLKVAELPLQKSCQNFGEMGNSVCSFRFVGLSEGLVLFGCPCVGSRSDSVEIRITIDLKAKKIQHTFISYLMFLCH